VESAVGCEAVLGWQRRGGLEDSAVSYTQQVDSEYPLLHQKYFLKHVFVMLELDGYG
jgi:hypothetical protein